MTRRVQRLQISDTFLLDGLTYARPAYEIEADPLPADAQLIDIRLDRAYGRVELLISSALFPEVEEDALPPLLPDPVFRRL